MMNFFKEGKSELILVLGVVAILMLLFVPIPPSLLDLLLLTNFSLALIILLLTFYTDRPLSFSTFPSLILIATLFRLGLNVSSTRLILNDASAGQVIGTIGDFVVGGNYVVGLVVFLILIVVQYVVVTNGAQRVAEVAARFTLDSMPGKQMSIDADLNMGIIDEHDAQKRRLDIEKEANFYGAMDGSTKFVKGDAIAGIIIILINIIGGLSIGVAQHGMSWGEAMHTFTLLTVGDGIVTQIPSLIIATATGIIITRAASDAQLGQELAKQITSHPKVLFIIAIALMCSLLMPGIPTFPVVFLASILAILGYFTAKSTHNHASVEDALGEHLDGEQVVNDPDSEIYQLTRVEPIELRLGGDAWEFVHADDSSLGMRLQSYRKQFALEFGLVLPKERFIQDKSIAPQNYQLFIHGAQVARGDVYAGKSLAIDPSGKKTGISGIETKEPTYGLPALWIEPDKEELARSGGYTVVDAETTVLTHLTETLKRFAPEIITRSETENLLSKLHASQTSLLEELVPNVLSYSEIHRVFQQLLQEKVSIRNLPIILEELLDCAKENKHIDYLVERSRQRLKNQICQSLTDNSGTLNVITFEPRIEQKLVAGVANDNNRLMLESQLTETILKGLTSKTEKMMLKRITPVLLCTPNIRRAIYLFCERALPQLQVVSLNEIPTSINVKSFAMITENG